MTETKPQKDVPYKVCTRFEVAECHKEKIGKVPCSVCSRHGEKYYSGFLVYFPREYKFRIIGHVCGDKHFGGNSFSKQIKVLEKIRSDLNSETYLLDNLLLVRPLLHLCDILFNRSREIEKIRKGIFAALTYAVAKRVLKDATDGELPIYADEVIFEYTAGDKKVKRIIPKKIASFRVQGLDFLEARNSGEPSAYRALSTLNQLPKSDDEIQDFLMTQKLIPGRLSETEIKFRDAIDEIKTSLAFVQTAKSFLSHKNFEILNKWASHPQSRFDLRVGVDRLGRLVISRIAGKTYVCEMRKCLTDPLPEYPKQLELLCSI